MRTIYNPLVTATIALIALPAVATAEEAAKANAGNTYNALLIGMVSLMFILLFAIAGLGIVLKQLAFAYRDKLRKEKENTHIVKAILFLVAFALPAYTFAGDAPDGAVTQAISSPYINGILKTDFYLLMGFIGFELVLVFALLLLVKIMVQLISGKQIDKQKKTAPKPLLDRFNKSVSVESEAVIVLDHDYDGIRELDNDLPPWWKNLFIATCIISVIYLWYYHVSDGPSQIEEYTAEVQRGEEEKAAYLAKSANNVDENTVTLIQDQVELNAAQAVFQSSCAACHAGDGGGGVGPNLTDDYWLHGGTIKDVFKTIKYGVAEKGMKSWKDDLSPKQIAGLASYIKSLKGTKPAAPKEHQGELFIEGGDRALDSLSAETQPAAVPVDKDTIVPLHKTRKAQHQK